jgi:two-component system cell cycle response regulator
VAGKILIVDAIATNRIVLKVKLASAYYQVLQAATGAEAAAIARQEEPDLVISALSLPDMEAADLCNLLKSCAETQHTPLIAIGCRPSAQGRLAALEAGVLDVLMKPVDDLLLLGRVRSVIRAHNTTAEWRMREDTGQPLGLAETAADFAPASHCMLVSADSARAQRWTMDLRPLLRARVTLANVAEVMRDPPGGKAADVFVLILPEDRVAAIATLRLICTLRANAETRHAGVLVLQTRPDAGLAADALDLGADDLMTDGFNAPELTLRLDALMRRKRMDARLRDSIRSGVKAAVRDPLTGLHNRRYAMPYLNRVAQHAQASGRPFAVMVADLDHFKRINDLYGHASGDAVLVEVARRLRDAVRASDLVARIGGEEFMIVMPGTTPEEARDAAVRICNDIGVAPFDLVDEVAQVQMTISIGMAIGDTGTRREVPADEQGVRLMAQADKALYSAKMRGRNRVTLSRPAA